MPQSLLGLALLALVFVSNATAQSRDIGAHSLILDDGAGHMIRISVPLGGWGGPGIYDWVLPIPPVGIEAGFVEVGTALNTALAWDDIGKYWKAVPPGGVGSGTENTIPKWQAGGTTLTNSIVTNDGARVTITDGALLVTGSMGPTPASGAGRRMMWIPEKQAFRAGEATGEQWDDASIGFNSYAMGSNAMATDFSTFALGDGCVANFAGAFAAGVNTIASGNVAFAFGLQTEASGHFSFASGGYSMATNQYTTAMGVQTVASGFASTAIGAGTVASGDQSLALGEGTDATGTASSALGKNTLASAQSATALGENTIASSTSATALGFGSVATAPYATALGKNTTASGNTSVSMGSSTVASGANSTAIGMNASTNGKTGAFVYSDASSVSVINNSVNNEFLVRATGGLRVISHLGSTTPEFSLLDGSMLLSGNIGATPASGAGTRMMWTPSKASFRAGEAIGGEWNTAMMGFWSTAMGIGTTASGDASTALGGYSIADDNYDLAAGYFALATGGASTALGAFAHATGQASFAAGGGTTASGINAVAIGSATTASGESAVALGSSTTASDIAATAIGLATQASGQNSFAFGNSTIASGYSSIAGGQFSSATAPSAIALGFDVSATGTESVALGSYCSTNNLDGAFVYGDASTVTTMNATAANQFTVRAAGGTRFFSNAAMNVGVELAAGANSWASISDSNRKENRLNIDGDVVLNKIGNIWLGSWNYKGQDAKLVRHYGPMAQEFFAAFGNDGIGVSGNDTTLSSADVDGINLIAIKALAARSNEQASSSAALRAQIAEIMKENAKLKMQNATLTERLENIESAVLVLAKSSKMNNAVTVSTK